ALIFAATSSLLLRWSLRSFLKAGRGYELQLSIQRDLAKLGSVTKRRCDDVAALCIRHGDRACDCDHLRRTAHDIVQVIRVACDVLCRAHPKYPFACSGISHFLWAAMAWTAPGFEHCCVDRTFGQRRGLCHRDRTGRPGVGLERSNRGGPGPGHDSLADLFEG